MFDQMSELFSTGENAQNSSIPADADRQGNTIFSNVLSLMWTEVRQSRANIGPPLWAGKP